MWNRNITGLDAEGTFRSLNGAADENVFIGKASKAGFFCFFKVWRDMPYDAVLDYEHILLKALRLVHITSLEEADLAHRLIVMQKTEPEGSKEAIAILLFALIVITGIVSYCRLIFWI